MEGTRNDGAKAKAAARRCLRHRRPAPQARGSHFAEGEMAWLPPNVQFAKPHKNKAEGLHFRFVF